MISHFQQGKPELQTMIPMKTIMANLMKIYMRLKESSDTFTQLFFPKSMVLVHFASSAIPHIILPGSNVNFPSPPVIPRITLRILTLSYCWHPSYYTPRGPSIA